MHDQCTEEWRPVPGWKDLYEVSSMGRVRSLDRSVTYTRGEKQITDRRRGVLLSLKPDSKGYARVTLRDGSRKTTIGVHRTVLMAFKGDPPSERSHSRHLNGDPQDNRVANLAWGTAAENAQDRSDHGRAVGAPILTAREVLAMRRLYAVGVRCVAMARAFGVHEDTVRQAVSGGSWASLPEAQAMGQDAHRSRKPCVARAVLGVSS